MPTETEAAERRMTRDDVSQLLYLETCAVDHFGYVKTEHMNDGDHLICKRWMEAGYIFYGRLKMEFTKPSQTHFVRLSDEAWADAARYRKLRGQRDSAKVTLDMLCGH